MTANAMPPRRKFFAPISRLNTRGGTESTAAGKDRSMRNFVIAIAAVSFAAAGVARAESQAPQAPAEVKVVAHGNGWGFTDAKGMTLYTFDGDDAAPGKSACVGPCAKQWPPVTAAADAKPVGAWTLIPRDDGASQWAYKGKPL